MKDKIKRHKSHVSSREARTRGWRGSLGKLRRIANEVIHSGNKEGLGNMENKEWENEPDKVEFEYLGFKCLIIRQPTMKHLCGYVGLPKWHPYYGKHYDDINVEVHGGLTFASEGDGGRWEKDYYWLGFDCAHYDDYIPGMEEVYRGIERPTILAVDKNQYRNIEYVKNELKHLAEQLTDEGMLERELKRR